MTPPPDASRAVQGRVPPHSGAAEQSVLGCILSGERQLAEVVAMLVPEDFYRPDHRLIYQAICDLYLSSRPVDIVTVADQLQDAGNLEKAGGLSYVGTLPDAAPVLSNAVHYADIVRQKAILRRLIQAMDEVAGLCYATEESAGTLLDLAAKRVFEIRENRDSTGFESLRDIMGRAVNEISAIAHGHKRQRAVLTGYPSIDRALTGLHKGSLIILAARPSMGKTALALNIAQKSALLHQTPVAIFSLEMSKEEVAGRMLSFQSQINSRNLRSGEIRSDEWERISRALPSLYAAPVYVDDRSGTGVVEMLAKCRQLKLEGRLGLVIIDYMQLMSGNGRADSRQQEISEISRSLKIMAKELSVPVMALSQLSRACEARSDKRPLLSDLRESGAIEQDADVVMFLYRDHYYDQNKMQLDVEDAELIIAKNRQGATGSVRMSWRPSFTMFFEPDDGLATPSLP